MSERRKFARVSSQLRCWCEGDDVTVFARIDNLGEGGVFLRTYAPLECGAKTKLRLGPDAEVQGRVVWRRLEGDGEGRAPGMGLVFEALDDQVRRAIGRIVEEERSLSR